VNVKAHVLSIRLELTANIQSKEFGKRKKNELRSELEGFNLAVRLRSTD